MKNKARIKGEVWLNLVLLLIILNIIFITFVNPLIFIFITFILIIYFLLSNKFVYCINAKKGIILTIPLFILNINFYLNDKINLNFKTIIDYPKEISMVVKEIKKDNHFFCKHALVNEVSPNIDKVNNYVINIKANNEINRLCKEGILVTILLNDLNNQNNFSIIKIKKNKKSDSILKKYINMFIYSDRIRTSAESFGFSLLTGDKSDLETNLKIKMINTGTAHLLAISGLHIGLFYFIIHKLISLFLKNLKIITCLALTTSFIYVASIDFQESATRALIMIVIFECSRMCFVKFSMLNSLTCTAILLILLDPYIIYNLSFQLSFTVVLFIILLVKENPVLSSRKNRIASRLLSYFLISLAASTGSSLIIIDAFNHFSFSSVFVNTLICPFFFIFFVCNLFYFIFASFFNYKFISFIHDVLFDLFFSIISYFDSIFSCLLPVIDIKINDFVHLINYFIVSFIICLNFSWKFRFFFILIYYLLIFFGFSFLT